MALIGRSVRLITVGFAAVLTLGACSGGDEGSAPVGTSGKVTQSSAELTKQPWCSYLEDEGKEYQVRVHLEEAGKISITYYVLEANGTRGEQVQKDEGAWELNGDLLKVTLDGEVDELKYKYEAKSQTGAPRLQVDTQNGPTVYDPCE